MKRRKNAVYTGQSKRARTRDRRDHTLVDAFYRTLNARLFPEDEIEIIPPKQVNPTHDEYDQIFIMTDYCVRKILPEVTSLFHWGDEVTPQLRALTPIVDKETAKAAAETAKAAVARASEAARASGGVFHTAVCVYHALVTVMDADDEAAYNRIIDLTNEMLESL